MSHRAGWTPHDCGCVASDAWRCAKLRRLPTIACHCRCHRYVDAPSGARGLTAWRVLALTLIVLLHVWLERQLAPAGGELRYAFLGFLIAAIGAAFGFLASGAAAAVTLLWRAFTTFGRTVWDFGKGVASAFVRLGSWLRSFYSNVLRPAVTGLYRWFLRFKKFLEDVFGPIIRLLESIRMHILKFYEKWIRPVFDTITVARRILQILDRLGVDWARTLDRKLAELEERMYWPIRTALKYINFAIEQVNRVMTLDGLIQRVTLIASLVRDVRLTTNLWWNSQSTPLTAAERQALLDAAAQSHTREHLGDLARFLDRGGGETGDRVDEFQRLVERELSGGRVA